MRGLVNFYSVVIACALVAAAALIAALLMLAVGAHRVALGFSLITVAALAFGLDEFFCLRRARREAMQRPPFTNTDSGFPEQPRRPIR